MKRIVFASAVLCAWTVAATVKFEPPQLPRSDFADTEAATNLAFNTGTVRDGRWTLNFELDALDVNCALAEFGIDANGDGVLAPDETELAIGWDCGEWVLRDRRSGECRRAPCPDGRRRLEWKLCLDEQRRVLSLDGNVFSGGARPTYFNPEWNSARVVVRGTCAANELLRSKISVNPFLVRFF